MPIVYNRKAIAKSEPKETLKKASIFDKKKSITRPEFREILKKSSPYIPGAGSMMYSLQKRIKMEKEIFPSSRFSSHITEIEVKRRLRELRTQRHRAKTKQEKIDTDRKIRFLQGVTGVKPY